MSKALATKNVAAALLGFAMIASTFAFATPANAQSASDLQAQINALLAQIAALQGGSQQTGGLQCTATFTLNLKVGSRGSEVMALQKFLNSVDGTQVAVSGAGSPGNETSYFGAATKAAVIKFQEKYAADILTPVGLSKGTGNWFASTRAKANALCASTPTNPTNPTNPVSGTLQVMAAQQPANSLAVAGAARVPFTRFTLTNTSSAAVTVNSVVVERTGLSANVNFDGVVLVDESTGMQLGIARILGSDNRATLGEAVTLQPGQSKTFTVAANMAASATVRAGEVASFAVVGINATGTVSGSLPITGAMHTMNASLTIGTATLAQGSLYPASNGIDQNIGTTDYAFNSLRVTAGSAEDIRVTSMRFNQTGSASASDLANMRIVVDGVSYPAVVSADGKYYSATFGSGLVITKGLSKEFTLRGDIVGGAGRTVSFDLYRFTDVGVVGQTYGYGITPSNNAWTGTPVLNTNDVDITGGTVQSISRSNVTQTGNVAVSVPSTALGSFNLSLTGESVQVQTVKIAINLTNNDATGTLDVDDITSITLVDQNGAVLAGPVDGSATDFSGVEGSVTFNGVTFPAGTTVFTVKGQLAGGDDAFEAGDTIILEPTLTEWSGATGMTTGNSVTLSGSATGNTMTVQAAALAVTTLATPVAASVVAGAQDYIFASGLLNASNSGEDIRVNSITIQDITSATADVNDLQNVEIWADLNSSASARGDKYETKISNTEQFTASAADADVTLALPLPATLVVAKNTSVEVAVIADLSSGAADTSTNRVDIDSVAAVSVTTGNSVTPTYSGAGQLMTVTTGGALTVTVDSSSPVASLLLDNTTLEQTIAVFNYTATNVESLAVERIIIDQLGTDDNDAVASYRLYNGTTLVGTVVNTGAATLTYDFASNVLVIPAGQTVRITVKAVMNDIVGTITNGSDVAVGLDSTVTRGQASSATVTVTEADDAATHEVYEAYPTFAFDNSGLSTTLVASANYLAAKITVTNPGNKDVTFVDPGTNNLRLTTNSSSDDDDAAAEETITIRDQNGITLDSGTYNNVGSDTVDFDFSDSTFTVPAGGSATLYVYVDTTDHENDGDNLTIVLDDAADNNVDFGIAGAGNYEVGTIVFRGDKFGPTHVNP